MTNEDTLMQIIIELFHVCTEEGTEKTAEMARFILSEKGFKIEEGLIQ